MRHPHPRIKSGAGSSLLPSRDLGDLSVDRMAGFLGVLRSGRSPQVATWEKVPPGMDTAMAWFAVEDGADVAFGEGGFGDAADGRDRGSQPIGSLGDQWRFRIVLGGC